MKKFIPLTILLLTLASLTSACAGVTLPWAAAPAADPLADFRIAMAPGQQDLLDDLPAMPVYRIETHIDPADLSLTGRMEVTLPAVEADALPEDLFFRLYPNLAHYAGSMSVDLVSVNDHGAPFSYEAANTAVHVVVPPDSVVAGKPIRVGSAWMAKSSRTGNDYLSLLINTPDGDLRVNAVQNEEQRGGQTFSIIPFIDSGEHPKDAGAGLSLVA